MVEPKSTQRHVRDKTPRTINHVFHFKSIFKKENLLNLHGSLVRQFITLKTKNQNKMFITWIFDLLKFPHKFHRMGCNTTQPYTIHNRTAQIEV